MISREKLKKNVAAAKNDTKSALQLLYDSLNQGQQKKLLKNEAVKKLLAFYNIVKG